jgi:hypothetical protein
LAWAHMPKSSGGISMSQYRGSRDKNIAYVPNS